mgnify:CR=1 FL=1
MPTGAPVGIVLWFSLASVAQVMTGVAAGMLAQVVLVIGFGAVPGRGGLDRCGDGPPPLTGRVDSGLHRLGDPLLLGGLRKDRRAILGSHVVALAVERGRVVQPEEPLLSRSS